MTAKSTDGCAVVPAALPRPFAARCRLPPTMTDISPSATSAAPLLSHLFDVHTVVHLKTKTTSLSGLEHGKHAITMVHADCQHNSVIVCIGSSLHMCQPPDAPPQLLAGSQLHNGFKDGVREHARLSTVHGVAVAQNSVILFTDWMNNCVREISTCGLVKTLYGAHPISLHVNGVCGFRDGHSGEARFHRPWGLCLDDHDQRLLVVDGNNSSIRRIDRVTGWVSTLIIRQDMSPDPHTGVLPTPTQLFYPSTIRIVSCAGNGTATPHSLIYVVSGSCFEVLRINPACGTFTSIPCIHNPHIKYRPVCIDITASRQLMIGYTGCELQTGQKNTKCVFFGDLDLFSAKRNVVYYVWRGKIEICACLCFSLGIDTGTGAATLWVSDAQAESRLLRVQLKLKWSMLRVLLLAVRKPTHGGLFACLPTCTDGSRSVCPLLDHIVTLLQGVVAFA